MTFWFNGSIKDNYYKRNVAKRFKNLRPSGYLVTAYANACFIIKGLADTVFV